MILKGQMCFWSGHSSTHSRFSPLMAVALSFESTSSMNENVLSERQVNLFGASFRTHSLKPQQYYVCLAAWGRGLTPLVFSGDLYDYLGHIWPLGLLLEALAPWHFPIYYKTFEVSLSKVVVSALPLPLLQNQEEWLNCGKVQRMGGMASFWPVCCFGSQCLGVFGPHQAPGSLKKLHSFHSQNRKDKSSPCNISLWEFKSFF